MTTRDAITLEHHSPPTAIVSLAGTLGRASRQELVTALAGAGERRNILVDLSRAENLHPSLVNAVQQTAERRIGTPARLGLVIPARAHLLRSLFETVGATSIPAVYTTRSEAIATLARAERASNGSTAESRRAA
jgi:hypothetical protein